jgi:serine protease Do
MRFLPRIVAETKIGKTAAITFWRGNASKTAQIAVGELDERDDDADNANKDTGKKDKDKKSDAETVMGMQISTLSPKLREELNVAETVSGVVVVDVAQGSEAGKRGIRAGDIIVDVHNMPVKSADDMKKAFEAALKNGRKFALVRIVRDKETAFITLPTSEEKKEKAKDKE